MTDETDDPIQENAVVRQAKSPPFYGRDWRSFWGKIALELFIVFVGVSGAFALDQYRAGRQRDELRRTVYRALDSELNQMAVTTGPRYNQEATRQLAEWDQALAMGEHPVPPMFRIAVDRVPTGVWKAAVQSQAIDLIKPALFFETARFYNRVEALSEKFERYSAAAEENIWPKLNEGPTAFLVRGSCTSASYATIFSRLLIGGAVIITALFLRAPLSDTDLWKGFAEASAHIAG